MVEYNIDVSNEPDFMKGYHIVRFLYDIRDKYLFPEDGNVIEYDELILNKNILELIDEINFVYAKDTREENSVRKVGNLLNFKVYLDPLGGNTIKMLAKGEKIILINIKL